MSENDKEKNAIEAVFTFDHEAYNAMKDHEKIDLITIMMELVQDKIKELGMYDDTTKSV